MYRETTVTDQNLYSQNKLFAALPPIVQRVLQIDKVLTQLAFKAPIALVQYAQMAQSACI